MRTCILILVFLCVQNAFAKNRYDIKDKRTGKIGFTYVGDQEMDHQPEWGKLAYKKFQKDLDEWESSVAINCEPIIVGYKPAPTPSPSIEPSPVVSPDPEASPEPSPQPTMVPVTLIECTVPRTYDVIVTDLTADEQAETQRQTQIATFKQRLKTLAAQSDMTAADLKEAIMKLLKMIVLRKDLD
jgi:hypothetical protein